MMLALLHANTSRSLRIVRPEVDTTRNLVALALGVWSVSAGAMPQQSAPVFRGNVELFTVRIGSRTPPVLFVEHVSIPNEAERARGPFAFFKPVPNQLSALYVVGVDANNADCGTVPKVKVMTKGLKVRATAWTAKRGCEPPGARMIQDAVEAGAV